MTFRRRALALVVAGALAFGVAGCSGHPAATPSTPTPAFTSDAAAYAAAEKVYRDYVDALNQVDLADPKTFEPVFALTTGDANAADRKGLSRYHADGVTIDGISIIKLLEPSDVSTDRERVDLAACVDVSGVRLTNTDGTSAVDIDRVPTQTVTVSLVADRSTDFAYRVERVAGREGPPACE
ncbi:hypothetical protein [Microbacterium rhizosphaerae]|uniref:Nuclear transport factor 2 family protein n=1 Tax=Microbacterium rhizosphaerae TaxID=1678237 RepID=A0ABZ0SHE1_9MICO|nr:hypothetical protein [Microbacterium rhizosphaerae]WPR88646.1 hypothetical protein SM116_12805 [Microbacterium rhizosphaerae]